MLLYRVKGEIKNEKILYFLYTRNNKDAQVMAFGLQLFRSYIRNITNLPKLICHHLPKNNSNVHFCG